MEEKTIQNQMEKQLPKTENEEAPKDPQSEKTEEQIKSLQAQKEHQRAKREEAEAEAARLKEENQQLQDKLKSSTPSEKEMRTANPDWDLLDEGEKQIRKKIAAQEKEIAVLKEKQAWDDDFRKLRKDSKFANIPEAEFREFAYKYPKSVDLKVLAQSYLFEKGERKELETPERPGLEKPTGGREAPKRTGYTAEDMERIRTTSPKRYEKMLREGKFEKVRFEKDEY